MASSSSSTVPAATLNNVPGELVQDGKHLIKISEENRNLVFVSPDIYRGQVYVNIREYFIPKEEIETDTSDEEEGEAVSTIPYLKATKKGVCLSELEFTLLINKLNRIQTLIKRLKKRQTKAQFRLEFQNEKRKCEQKPEDPTRPKASFSL